MKSILLLLLTIVPAACADQHSYSYSTQGITDCTHIIGSGVSVKQQRCVGDFYGINASIGNIKFSIAEHSVGSAVVESDDNIIEHIVTEVKDGILYISLDTSSGCISIDTKKPITIQVSSSQLQQLKMSGATNFRSETVLRDNLAIVASGASNIVAKIEAKKLKVTSSGASNFFLSGAVEAQKTKISGAGNYKAADLKSNCVDLKISGAANVKVSAGELLSGKLSGAARVYYEGNPRVTLKSSGLSSIRQTN